MSQEPLVLASPGPRQAVHILVCPDTAFNKLLKSLNFLKLNVILFKAPSPQRGPNSSPHHEGAGPPFYPGGREGGGGGLAKAVAKLKAAPQG